MLFPNRYSRVTKATHTNKHTHHLEGWDVLYNIIFCYIASILLHNRNLFFYIAFNLMLYSICYNGLVFFLYNAIYYIEMVI